VPLVQHPHCINGTSRKDAAMRTDPMYPTELTEEESGLGYQLALVGNPRRVFSGNSSLMPVVLYSVGPLSCIFKTRDSDGNILYSHRQHGDFGKSDRAEWNPVLVPVPSPADAIRIAKEGLDAQLAARQGLGIDPAMPALDLQCPACHYPFSVRKDFLGIGEVVVCTKCSRAHSAKDCAS